MARNKIEFAITAKDDASAKLKNVSNNVDAINSSIKRLASTAIAALGVNQIAAYADTWRLLENRIKLVTKSTVELKQVQQALVDVSTKTRSSFESTANLYARVARSSRELGLSQRELLDFTTTVQQSIRVSGSTAAEASAGVIQFGQALASSRLSGDELRSVLEQMPRLAQAIAEGMGVGIGTLRELGEAGKLSTDVVLEALRKSAPAIQEEFSKLSPLVSEAFVVLQSSVMSAVGTIDSSIEVSKTLALALLDAAQQVRLLGSAITGKLTDSELDKLSEKTAIAAGAILGLSFAIGTLKDGLDLSLGSFGDLATNITSRMAEAADAGGMLNADAVGKGLRLAWEDTLTDVMNNVEEQNADIFESYATLVSRIQNIVSGGFEAPTVDLTKAGGALDQLTRAQRETIAKAAKDLETLQNKLVDQGQAFVFAREHGVEYAKAMEAVKISNAGAISGQRELADNLLLTVEALDEVKKEFDANKALEKLQNDLIGSSQAYILAARSGIDYADALQIIEIRTLAAKAGNEQLGENLILVAKQVAETAKTYDAQMKFMQNAAESAAKSIQTAFADFLFDPFEDGIKGMLASFLTVIRRMVAEMIAFNALSGIPGIGKIFAGGGVAGLFGGGASGSAGAVIKAGSGGGPGIFGGGLASGGPFNAGQPLLVGERGVEGVVFNSPGRIINNSAMKSGHGSAAGAQFVTNIDARGADPGLIARLPMILDQRDKRLLLAVQRYSETGIMPS